MARKKWLEFQNGKMAVNWGKVRKFSAKWICTPENSIYAPIAAEFAPLSTTRTWRETECGCGTEEGWKANFKP